MRLKEEEEEIQIDEEGDQDQEEGLLDSGATHAVRPAGKSEGMIKEVEVELAGNVTVRMKMNEGNTVLGPKGQYIVPLIPIMEQLGCKLETNRKGTLQVLHPQRGILPINISSGAPTCNRRRRKRREGMAVRGR